MKKYKNKYRIKSARHPNWDYSSNGLYFVTICTQNREHFFGEIDNNKMNLSEIGKIVNQCWSQIPEHFPFVVLHNHIVMPNHIHGIIEIAKNDDGFNDDGDNVGDCNIETQYFASLPQTITTNESKNKFGPQSKNLASIVRGFKIGVTKNVKNINPDFKWQPRYHDHIIRNDKSFHTICNYIEQNPLNWEKDKFYE
jgi:REP element-mobilizing transposase RayT